MRLYPPAYFMDRVNLEEDEFNGMKFDKNSNLLFSFYEIHRSEKHWEKPLEFNPDRFTSNKNPEKKDRMAIAAYYDARQPKASKK